ncbi:hypothetical protein ASPWEDRAFT_175507 [Aspergillus wentii DTO 134E9]|uniref:Peptidase M4 C-terminal domain-containing protein n=1 Tax=Aspergillus wentii DTO 134E9 TaxID=1073089 RepID=A0A1L9RBE8_ASPWE|nr:uncharacterized protein ASPWEDRAFT_175507 [Aspergillus wentii DTO 134E9]OJJ32208.1 hypothetical protein ASPWEDRAFT_175507 [Aspergillus wentii DTO 134E9]
MDTLTNTENDEKNDRNQDWCFFMPPYLLKAIAESTQVPPESCEAAAKTLEFDGNIRNGRISLIRQPGPAARAASSFVKESTSTEVATPATCYIHDCEGSTDLPRRLVRKNEVRVKDRPANNAYDGLRIASEFFNTVFKRKSIDNASLPLIGSVHFGTDYNNAFWDGNQMVFGDGDGLYFDYLTVSLEVIVHELTHDVFAIMAEQWHFNQTVTDAGWTLGQGVFPMPRRGAGIRSLKAPGTAYDDYLGKDPQASHMDNYVETHEDNCGVHYNSGIPNHAFYLAATRLGGYSWERVGQIWYTTLQDSRLKPKSTFREFAKVSAEIAQTQFGKTAYDVVKNAWASVGVL